MKSITAIYKIINNANGEFYIGSSVNISKRKSAHFKELEKGKHANQHLQRAWNKYGKDNFSFVIIEVCKKEDLLKREQFYIDSENPKYNIAKIVSAPMLGIKLSEEAKKRISANLTGRPCSQETREKIRSAQKGKPRKKHTQEFKDRMSALFKGRIISDKQKDWLREYRKGKSFMSDDAKKRLSERMKGVKTCLGYKHTDEARKNMSAAHKGKKLSQEQKSKISESGKIAWIKRKSNISNGENKSENNVA